MAIITILLLNRLALTLNDYNNIINSIKNDYTSVCRHLIDACLQGGNYEK